MCTVGKEIVIDMNGTPYDGNRAMVIEKNDMGFLKVQLMEMENFGKKLTITKYNVKD